MKIIEVIRASSRPVSTPDEYTFIINKLPEPETARTSNGSPKVTKPPKVSGHKYIRGARHHTPSLTKPPIDSIYMNIGAGRFTTGWGNIFKSLEEAELPNTTINAFDKSIALVNESLTEHGYGEVAIVRVTVLYYPLKIFVDLANNKYKLGMSYINGFKNGSGIRILHTAKGTMPASQAGIIIPIKIGDQIKITRDPMYKTHNSSDIKNIDNEIIVRENPFSINYIKNPSEFLQLIAVQENGFAIKNIENPSENIQLAAVEENPWAIRYIENPSTTIIIKAIDADPTVFKIVTNPSRIAQLTAVKRDPTAFYYIKYPDPLVVEYMKKYHSELIK